jgi:hypothetical protein
MQPGDWLRQAKHRWFYRLIFGLIFGLKADIEVRSRPNQGIWNSRNNMVITSGIALLITPILCLGLSQFLPLMVEPAIVQSIISGVIYFPFLMGFLYGGGKACIQHFALRLVLHRAKLIPWNWVTFLQQAEDRLFIRRTGGSYIFVHRYLQEHFASRVSH